MQLEFGNGGTYGVAMPVIAYFSARFTDARVLQAATTVTVNGVAASGGRWYFEQSPRAGFPVEGHYRLNTYWPAHARIHVSIKAAGLSAGPGYGFADNLTTDFRTGAAQLVSVDGTAHTLTLLTDGHKTATFPVSLGKAGLATMSGTKVIMEHLPDVEMSGPGYDDPDVKWDERLNYEGEYLHAAPWNIYNIEHGVDSSHGCTNLRPADAEFLFDRLRVGDPVTYTRIREATSPISMSDGWADWNLPNSVWQSGGLIRTR